MMQLGSRRMVRRALRIAAVAVAAAIPLGLAATGAAAQEGDDACVYDRRSYPEGYEMCQGSRRVRCEDGAWGDIGICDDSEPGPSPTTEGGDVERR